MSRKLPNYLRTHRKRAGLSQRELAFVLGCSAGPKVSYYEGSNRMPTLETVLAYEALFGIPARELFAGLYAKVEQDTSKRARLLADRIASCRTSAVARKKMLTLNNVAGLSGPSHATLSQTGTGR